MTAGPGRDRVGGVDDRLAPDAPAGTGSPAVLLTAGLGLVGLLTSLNGGAFALSLFFSAAALAALPMALADRPRGRPLAVTTLGAASAVLGLVLVLVPLVTGEAQRTERTSDPVREDDRPKLPGRASPTATPPAG